MVGALIGSIAIAKPMGYLLEHFEVEVYYAVCGIVAAAVVILIERDCALLANYRYAGCCIGCSCQSPRLGFWQLSFG